MDLSDYFNCVENTFACSTTTSKCQAALLVDGALATVCMPCISWFQSHCKQCLEDLRFLKICFSTSLLLHIGIPLLHVESNWSMMHCLNLTKAINFDYQIGQKVLKYGKTLKGKLKPKTTRPFGIHQVHSNSTVILIWDLVLSKILIFATLCHIASPHLCNLTPNPWFFLINYGEGEIYATLHLLQNSWESSCVDVFSSCLWFFMTSWALAMYAPLSSFCCMSFCVLNTLSSSIPTLL